MSTKPPAEKKASEEKYCYVKLHRGSGIPPVIGVVNTPGSLETIRTLDAFKDVDGSIVVKTDNGKIVRVKMPA